MIVHVREIPREEMHLLPIADLHRQIDSDRRELRQAAKPGFEPERNRSRGKSGRRSDTADGGAGAQFA